MLKSGKSIKHSFPRLHAALALGVVAMTMLAQGVAADTTTGVVMPHSQQWSTRSADGKRTYRIFARAPSTEAPSAGFPVIYVLDGNDSFATAADHARRLYGEHEQTGYGPALVVAIGYPIDGSHDEVRRTFDLTPVAPEGSLPEWGGGQEWPRTGGADLFLEFIESTVKPEVARRYRIDSARETLMGHSFGGLFTLNALLTKPAAFDNYVAISASIWYGDRLLLKKVDALAAANRSIDARLLIITGACEQTPGECGSTIADRDGERDKFLLYARQVDNARAMSESLSKLRDKGLRTELVLIDGEQHTTVVPAAIGRGVRFALSQGR